MSQSPSKEEQILDAAHPLFVRYGPRKTTIDDIAKAAGLGKGTIYLYFESKEQIFAASVRRNCEAFLDVIERGVSSESDVAAKLRVYVLGRFEIFERMMKGYGGTPERFHEAHLIPEFRTTIAECMARERRLLRGIIEQGIAAGAFKVSELDVAVETISTAVHGLITSSWNFEPSQLSVEQKVDALVDLLINGLKGVKKA